MEHIKIDTDKIEKLKINRANWDIKKPTKIFSDLHLATKEAIDYFQEPKKFALYLGYIRRITPQEARKRIANQKEQNIRNPKFFFKKQK